MNLTTARGRAKARLRLLAEGALARLPAPSQDGGVLLVRLDAIGDFLLWQRTAASYRAIYPGRHLVLAANALWAPLASRLPYWDEVVAIEMPRLDYDRRYRMRTFRALRRRNFSVALQPTFSRILVYGDSVVRASGASARIGFDGDLANMPAIAKAWSDRWYTTLIAAERGARTELERNDEFLLKLGCREVAADALPTVAVLPAELRIDRPYFIVFPGASWTGRQWPAERFARLIELVGTRFPGWLPILCGSADERGLCDDVAARTSAPCATLAGKTSLAEFCEVVRGARLLVGNETSAIHVAAAVGTPSVCLLGGGHFGRFVPYPAAFRGRAPEPVYEPMPCYGCNWKCRLPHAAGDAVPCVAAITLEAVGDAIDRALASPPRGVDGVRIA